MELRKILSERIHLQEVKRISSECSGRENDSAKEILFSFVTDSDRRVSYNALWVFTHFLKEDAEWLRPRRNLLIDLLLSTTHIGCRRLLLTLLDAQTIGEEDVRIDYLDFCLSRINSCEPYAIRAFCMKQAFAQCRFYPELIDELIAEIDMLEIGELSPGLRSARNNTLKKIRVLRLQK